MTRDKLLNSICPVSKMYDCYSKVTNCDDCNRVLEEWLDEHDKQIRAEVINEFAMKLYKGCNEMIKQTWGSNTAPISWAEAYADFKDDIYQIAEQFKEQGK